VLAPTAGPDTLAAQRYHPRFALRPGFGLEPDPLRNGEHHSGEASVVHELTLESGNRAPLSFYSMQSPRSPQSYEAQEYLQ